MPGRNTLRVLAAVVALAAGVVPTATAARLVYHYNASELGPFPGPYPGGSPLPSAERLSWFGAVRTPNGIPPPRPTARVTYRHPFTGQPVTVPLALFDSTPRIEYHTYRVVYDYGSETVSVRFLPNGSVDVIYDSGFLRAPR